MFELLNQDVMALYFIYRKYISPGMKYITGEIIIIIIYIRSDDV